MKPLATFLLLFIAALTAFTACNPKIYSFTADPATISPDTPIHIHWKVKGHPTLLLHDIKYNNSDSSVLFSQTLLIKYKGSTMPYTLNASDTIRLPLDSSEDSLEIRKQPDSHSDDRLRYITLVVSRDGKELPRTVQVAVRPDLASDEIGFRDSLRGDTLIASGINNPARWGNNFEIVTVTEGSNREMEVIHANIDKVLPRGGPPDASFKGTPVAGNWMFRSLLTPEEKNNPRLLPAGLKIHIIIKHH